MINERENGFFTVSLCERSFGTETSTDLTLPDYQSEIRRIINVSATPLPPARYVGADNVEFNGTVDYQVLYVGGDGALYTVPLSGEYSFNVPYERGECDTQSINVLCSVGVESASARVSAPRRLNIRARLRPSVRIYGKRTTDTAILNEVDPTSVYKKEERCECVLCESAVSDVITLNETLPLASDETRVVSADTRICIDSCEYQGEGMTCRGNVKLKLLCANDSGGEYQAVEKSIPFEGGLDIPLGADAASCKARGVVSETSVNVVGSSAECSIGILLEGFAARNAEMEYTSDVYSTKNECEISYEEIQPRSLLTCGVWGLTVNERLPLSQTGIPEDAKLIDTLCTASFDKCELIDGKPTFGGNADFCVIYKKDDEIYAANVKLPIKYTAASADMDIVSFDCCSEPTDVSARIEQGELRLGVELMICADCMGESSVQMADSVRFAEAVDKRESEVIVCYPAYDDTLWSVAKRYKVAPADVLGDPAEDKYVIIE